MVPLFPASVPGGTELVVILLIAVFGFVPLLAIVAGAYLFGKSRGTAEAEERDRDRDRTN